MLISDSYTIGNRLYKYRRKKKLSQIELSEAAAISVRAYANIERGAAGMRVNTLIRICQVLDITPNMLLVDDEADPDMVKDDLHRRIESASKHQLYDIERFLEFYSEIKDEK